jgi:hypothetical protein
MVTWAAGAALLLPGVVVTVLMAIVHPLPEGPHAFGSGYGVGRPRPAAMVNGPDRAGEGRVSQTGFDDYLPPPESDRAH